MGRHSAPSRDDVMAAKWGGRALTGTPLRSDIRWRMAGWAAILRLVRRERASSVLSSGVGPRPPVMKMKWGLRPRASSRTERIPSASSRTQVILWTRAPRRVTWSAIQKELVS